MQGYHFSDNKCEQRTSDSKDGPFEIRWGECFYNPIVSPFVLRLTSTQTDFDSMSTGSKKISKAAIKFDRYFAYAIDHKGKESGMLEPGCYSSRDCESRSSSSRFCCAHAEIYDRPTSGEKRIDRLRCMDKKVVHQNRDTRIEDVKMNLRCLDYDTSSSAVRTATLVTIFATLGLAITSFV